MLDSLLRGFTKQARGPPYFRGVGLSGCQLSAQLGHTGSSGMSVF